MFHTSESGLRWSALLNLFLYRARPQSPGTSCSKSKMGRTVRRCFKHGSPTSTHMEDGETSAPTTPMFFNSRTPYHRYTVPQSWCCCCKDAWTHASGLPSRVPPWTGTLSVPLSPACSRCTCAGLSVESGEKQHISVQLALRTTLTNLHADDWQDDISATSRFGIATSRKQDECTNGVCKCHPCKFAQVPPQDIYSVLCSSSLSDKTARAISCISSHKCYNQG